MRDPEVFVIVCIPNTGSWCDEMAKSTVLMFSHFNLCPVIGAKSQRIGIISIQGSGIAHQRHLCVKKACQVPKATHILFLDSDMEFPKDLLHRMLLHDKDILALNCTTRREPIVPVAFDFANKRINSRGRHGLEKIRSTGLAVALLRVDMLKKLRPPLFLQDWVPDAGNYCGEDVYFTQVAQAAGYDVWTDHDLSVEIKHVGAREWGYDDVRQEDVDVASVPVRIIKEGALP